MDQLRPLSSLPRDSTLRSFVQLVPQLPLKAGRIPCPVSQQHLYLGLAEPKLPCQVADRRTLLCMLRGFNGRTGLLLRKTLVLPIKLVGNLRGAFRFASPHNTRVPTARQQPAPSEGAPRIQSCRRTSAVEWGVKDLVQVPEFVSRPASNSCLGLGNGFVTVTPFHVKPSCKSSERSRRQPASAAAERITASQIVS